MGNIFAMVTLKSSNFYTSYAITSFFENTNLGGDDEFLLINNDKCEIKKNFVYEKINVIENKKPLSFGQNVNQAISIAKKNKKNLVFLNNDIIFTKNWFDPLNLNSESISIPTSNLLFKYKSNCGSLILKSTMRFDEFNDNYDLLSSHFFPALIKKIHDAKEFKISVLDSNYWIMNLDHIIMKHLIFLNMQQVIF